MRIRLVRRPGQPGTHRYVEEYGDRLICLRYRYDSATARRYKTVEIIVEEKPWQPPQATPATQPTPTTPTALGGPAAPLPPPPPPPPPPPRIRADTRAHPTAPSMPVRADPRVRPAPPAPSKPASEAHPTAPSMPVRADPRVRPAPPHATTPIATEQPDQHQEYSPETLVAVHIKADKQNIELRRNMLKSGAIFDTTHNFWRIPYADVVQFGLQHNILGAVADLTGE